MWYELHKLFKSFKVKFAQCGTTVVEEAFALVPLPVVVYHYIPSPAIITVVLATLRHLCAQDSLISIPGCSFPLSYLIMKSCQPLSDGRRKRLKCVWGLLSAAIPELRPLDGLRGERGLSLLFYLLDFNDLLRRTRGHGSNLGNKCPENSSLVFVSCSSRRTTDKNHSTARTVIQMEVPVAN